MSDPTDTTAGRWCRRCGAERPMEWAADVAFGMRAESARCPICGVVWGVRERRAWKPITRVAPLPTPAPAPRPWGPRL